MGRKDAVVSVETVTCGSKDVFQSRRVTNISLYDELLDHDDIYVLLYHLS